MKTTTAIKRLEKIAKDYQSGTDLIRSVAKSIIYHLDGYIKADDFFKDLQQGGCSSGMISELIYYKDTYKFFDDNYSDIMDLVASLNEQGLEIDLMKDGNIKNTGAWLAYEETANQLGANIGIEL